MDKETKDLLVFGYGLGIISGFCALAGCLKHGFHFVPMVFFVCSIIFISVTRLDLLAFKSSYRVWMKVSYRIGRVVTDLILSAVFILIFTPIGLFFRLTGKDHLQRQIDPKAKTYWRKRKKETFQKERYQQQF
jgi:hypothetical protein